MGRPRKAAGEGRGDRARAGRRAIPASGDLERVSGLFRMLGDPGRARLLYALLAGGEMCVGDLARATGATENAVSQALRLLRAAAVVRSRRQGRHVYYRLEDDHVRSLLEAGRGHVGHGRRRRVRPPREVGR